MRKLFTLLFLAILSLTTWAYDFQVGRLCYNILSETEVEVTYQQDPWLNDGAYASLSGALTIPSTVIYNGTTYTVTGIGYFAFTNCSSLISVTIPNSVTNIESGPFAYCSSLTNIQVESGNLSYISENGVLFNADKTILVQYPAGKTETTYTIPNGVISIGDNAFSISSSLASVTIPNSVTSIGNYAFEGTALYNDPSNWVNNVLYIGNCLIDANMELSGAYDIVAGTKVIAGSAFQYCPSLTSVTIPNSVTSIGDNVFSNCSSLTSIIIPNSVISIGDNVFSNCSSLTSIIIPNSVTSIGDNVFSNCSSLTSITIPNSVTSIGNFAFQGCISLTSITIPNSVTSIGIDVFAGVGQLSVYKNYSSIVLEVPFVKMSPSLDTLACPITELNQITEEQLLTCSKQVKSITVHSGQLDANGFAYVTRQKKTLAILDMENTTNTELTDMAVYDCYKLHTIKLPSTLEYIGYKAVAECRMLQEITIPASVTEIDDSAFENCRSLSAIHFGGTTTPEGQASYALAASESALQRIGNWAFYNCHQLQELTIPEGVTEIGDAAFYGCTYLEDLVLPSSLQSIGDNCFALCSKLQQITVQSTTPPTIESKTFYDVKRTIPVYVPEGTLESYQNDIYWSEFLLQEGESTTALSQIQDDQTGCYTANGMLYNPNGISLCIYTVQGTLVYIGNAAEIQMPSQGIYILKTPAATSKVIL